MSGFYSLVVLVDEELPVPEQRLILWPGTNVFNAQLDDAEAFCAWLTQQGCTVQQINRLDGPESQPFSGNSDLVLV